jgi:dienelactone hydrolase
MILPILLLISSLEGLERGETEFRATAAEASIPEIFRLPNSVFRYEMETRLETPRHTVRALRFSSPVTTPDLENNTVHAEYFLPVGSGPDRRRPAVIVLHILGADFALSRYIAARLADAEVAALFVKLPYYGERRPAGGQKRFLSGDLDRSVLSMRQGVCDVRRASAWLASRPEIDPARLGITGVSLGGIVASIAAAVDPTLNQAVFLLAGGDLAQILWEMPEPEARRYREAWTRSGRSFNDLKAVTTPLDPLTYAERLKTKRVLMIAGNVDEIVPPASARKLWEAAGRPPIVWEDCGHYSAIGFLLPAVRRTVDFFAGSASR